MSSLSLYLSNKSKQYILTALKLILFAQMRSFFYFYFFRYEGKLWYINLDGSFDVLFNDGDRRTCLPAPLVRWTGTTTDGSKQPKQQTEQSATKIDYKLGE